MQVGQPSTYYKPFSVVLVDIDEALNAGQVVEPRNEMHCAIAVGRLKAARAARSDALADGHARGCCDLDEEERFDFIALTA
jgi:hypothetical protein